MVLEGIDKTEAAVRCIKNMVFKRSKINRIYATDAMQAAQQPAGIDLRTAGSLYPATDCRPARALSAEKMHSEARRVLS